MTLPDKLPRSPLRREKNRQFARCWRSVAGADSFHIMKLTAAILSLFALWLLATGCASDAGPSRIDRLADRDRFMAALPASFPVATRMSDETAMRKWVAELPPGREATVLALSQSDKAELLAARRAPQYPVSQLLEQAAAEVELLLAIDRNGNVVDLCVINKPGDDFIIAAVTACRYWKYTPLLLAGQPGIGVIYERVGFRVGRR